MIILLLSLAFAAEVKDVSLLKAFPQEPLLNEIIAFEPVEGHHFNLKAKNACGNGRVVNVTEEKVECQMFAPGKSNLELFICDAKQTFCRREIVEIRTHQPKGFKAWVNYYKSSMQSPNSWSTPYKTGQSQNPPARGFGNDIETAKKLAKKEKKKVLVYLSQLSCGPCRQMKELSFQADEFQELTKNYVRLQVDIDVDQDPEWVKGLAIIGTPTVIVLNKDFEELDRRTGAVMSPASFKTWLASIPDVKIEKLKNMPKEHKSKHVMQTSNTLINDEQKERLALWHYHAEPGVEQAVALLKEIKNKSADVNFLIELFETENLKDNAQALAQLKKLEPVSRGKYREEYRNIVASRAVKVVLDKDSKQWSEAVAQLKALDAVPNGDPLQKALDQLQTDSLLVYGAKKMDPKKAVAYSQAEVAHIDAVPRLPGVTQTPYMSLLRAEALEDSAAKNQALNQLKEENKNDYSYDFVDAVHALKEQKFEEALTLIDKSLVVAKDRSFQKAFLIKLDILEALKRQQEGLVLIETLLKETQLPTSTAPRVHGFVQSLRKKQLAWKQQLPAA